MNRATAALLAVLATGTMMTACTQNEPVPAAKSAEIATNEQEHRYPVIDEIRQDFAARLADNARETMEKTQSGIVVADETLAAR